MMEIKDKMDNTRGIEIFLRYGKFIHIMDCDGNKIELWEPFPVSES